MVEVKNDELDSFFDDNESKHTAVNSKNPKEDDDKPAFEYLEDEEPDFI